MTVDRHGTTTGRGFENGKSAHSFVTEHRLISHLMRQLGIKRWVWSLEFHGGDDGWPHWHLVVDLSDFPGGRLPVERLREAWRWWRDHWRIGGVDLQRRRFDGPEHAIRYITKYLTKFPSEGFPAWVLASRRVRFCGTSKAVGAIVAKSGHSEADSPPKDGMASDQRCAEANATQSEKKTSRREASTLGARMNDCEQTTVIFQEYESEESGELRMRWVGDLRIPYAAILCDESPLPVLKLVQEVHYHHRDGTVQKVRLRCYLACTAAEAINRIEPPLLAEHARQKNVGLAHFSNDGSPP